MLKQQQQQQQQQQQPTSPSCSSISNPTPKTTKDLMQIITQFLERGQQSALQMRNIIHKKRSGFKFEDHDDDQQQVSFDHHTWVALDSIESCLSMIKSYDHLEDDMKKRKLDHQSGNSDAECSDHSSIKSEDTSDGGKFHRERRGCYKRRKTGQTWTVEATNLIDDGHAWRKYGQKEILNTKFPRNYYRCTHKNDQNCQATKQVQQISENPTKYTIIYHGDHTCKTPLKTPSIFIDNTSEENSPFFLSFETKNYPPSKHALTPSSMFPSSSAFHNNYNNNRPTLEVKQEQPHPINNETPLAPHDLDHDHDHDHNHNQYSSSSDNHKPSPSPSPSSSSSLSDLTNTGFPSTPVSEQGDVISSSPSPSPSPPLAEFHSSINISSPYEMNGDDMINFINMDQHLNASLNDGFWADLWA